jgi:hypothetical protein
MRERVDRLTRAFDNLQEVAVVKQQQARQTRLFVSLTCMGQQVAERLTVEVNRC